MLWRLLVDQLTNKTIREGIRTMSDEIKTDYELTKYCDELAQGIVSEYQEYGGDIQDAIWQRVDGNEYVIYTYKAHSICLHCDTDQGEQFLEEMGMPENPTYNSLGVTIAFGEMLARTEQAVQTICEEKGIEI